ncbi:MAG: DUF169 domain-containing protein [Halodesulfurarchaeum sp.]|nr:DUF169 domain-containing protein [Halodesulfurarchaeum sp.]
MSIQIQQQDCIGCGTCAEICPADVFEMDDGRPVLADESACTLCGVCADQCPTDAIDIRKERNGTEYDVEFEAEQRYVDWAESLQEILDLEKHPVGIKLVNGNGDVPEEVKQLDVPVRHCVSIHMGSLGETFYLPAEGHACAAAKAALGISELPEKVASGKVPHMHGLASSQEAAARIMEEVPRTSEETAGTLIGPLGNAPFEPDVVVLVLRPEQAMWVANSMLFEDGGPRVTANFAGMQASCGDVTALPYEEGEVNFSLGCYGCRSAGKLGASEMYVGIPRGEMAGSFRASRASRGR